MLAADKSAGKVLQLLEVSEASLPIRCLLPNQNFHNVWYSKLAHSKNFAETTGHRNPLKEVAIFASI